MKKNKMMRVASGLMVAVLMTTSAISGTFAKYVTSDTVNDSARVAKWGVNVRTSGALYAENYAQHHDPAISGDNFASTVISSGGDVVAPGTHSTDVTSAPMTFTLSGTPEVAVEVSIAITSADVVLPASSTPLPNFTTGDPSDTFDHTVAYYPIKYTLQKDGADVAGCVNTSLADIEAYLEGLSGNFRANATPTIFGTYTITWDWDFDTGHDEADTFLGQLAANNSDANAAKPSGTVINPSFEITITVTQID